MSNESMFDPDDILVKTEKGSRETGKQTAESALPRRMRSLLMVVDGKSPFHIYEETLSNYGDVASLYEALVTGGYLERRGRTRKGRDTPNPEPSEAKTVEPMPSASSEVPNGMDGTEKRGDPRNPEQPAGRGMDAYEFRELMSDISTLVTEKLGADSMQILMKVEAVETPQQLLDILPELAEALRSGMGNRDVKRFVSAVRKQLA